MSNKPIKERSFLRLAQEVANLLENEGQPLAVKEIVRKLRRSGLFYGNKSGVNCAIRDHADTLGFVRLRDNRWTIRATKDRDA